MSALDNETAGEGNIVASRAGLGAGETISPEEWAVRVDLAIAYRLLDWLDMTDLIHTHVSVRVPGESEQFLQLPYGHLFGEARASQMVKVDPEGIDPEYMLQDGKVIRFLVCTQSRPVIRWRDWRKRMAQRPLSSPMLIKPSIPNPIWSWGKPSLSPAILARPHPKQ